MLLKKHGKNYEMISRELGTRTIKQCETRCTYWRQYVDDFEDPEIKELLKSRRQKNGNLDYEQCMDKLVILLRKHGRNYK